jgi:monovalent cation:H+ antiporter-2, CPA2 family
MRAEKRRYRNSLAGKEHSMMEHLAQILLLLGVAVTVVVTFQRLHVPTSLGYLLVGVILGPHTIGPAVYVPQFKTLAEFGVVFLLFTIGLNFSLPRLHALRHQVLGLGTGQVVFTTVLVGAAVWLAGVSPAAAFVIGAVFAQSSTTIIGSQLAEQGEENSHHGRLGLAMSVFQDVTAVPFLVIIPVLGVSIGPYVLAGALGWAFAKAMLAFALVFFAGRWLLRPLFHVVAARRSAEIFTLAVLLIALLAAWTTSSLGLSLAFGGFLAGMMLGETEFRHQVESSIRPFRDVLLGLFFVGIGMRFDLTAIPPIWHWAVLGALLILLSKMLIVAAMLRRIGIDAQAAWRTGLLLAVGGEFGLAFDGRGRAPYPVQRRYRILADTGEIRRGRQPAGGAAGRDGTAGDHRRLWTRGPYHSGVTAFERRSFHSLRYRPQTGGAGAHRRLSRVLRRYFRS